MTWSTPKSSAVSYASFVCDLDCVVWKEKKSDNVAKSTLKHVMDRDQYLSKFLKEPAGIFDNALSKVSVALT